MEYPRILHIYAEIIEKQFDDFALDDWRNAAIVATRQYEKLLSPPAKKRGRPTKRKIKTLLDLADIRFESAHRQKRSIASPPKAKLSVGRPRSTYGKKQVSIEWISNMLDLVLAPETKVKYGDRVPKSKLAAMQMILRSIKHPPFYAASLLRGVRRQERTKIEK